MEHFSRLRPHKKRGIEAWKKPYFGDIGIHETMSSQAPIALFGKVGHGKTYLLNKLCGSSFPSDMGARSCTRHVQLSHTRRYKIPTIDTPGFGASEDLAGHLGAQTVALEGIPLSGVYVVIKYSRADDIAIMVDDIMKFVSDNDIRLIVTHSDVACQESGYDEHKLKERLNELLDIPVKNMSVVGKNTSWESLEEFVYSTRHEPRDFTVTDESLALMAAKSLGQRSLNKAIDTIHAKIEAARKCCFEMIENGGKCYETDLAVIVTQNTACDMIKDAKDGIFREAMDLPSSDEQNLVFGKAGLALSIRRKDFMEATNKCLSWDVTDVSDARNVYKACNHCGAVYNKTEGCNGVTTCGDIPRAYKRDRPKLFAQFQSANKGWVVQYFLNGTEIVIGNVRYYLASYTKETVQMGGPTTNRKRDRSTFESGCGGQINWSRMLPVDPEQIKALGVVEMDKPELFEEVFKVKFHDRVREKQEENRAILLDGLN